MDGRMKTEFNNEHASCRVVQNPELPSDMDRVREVSRVWTEPGSRKQGYATELMSTVCDEADSEGVVLILQPKPFGDRWPKGAGAKDQSAYLALKAEKLEAWYRRFGFIRTQSNPVLMARAPSFRPKMTAVVHAVDGVVRG